MAWYVELHCDHAGCPHGAREEGPQGKDKAAVAAEAKRCGWRKLNSGRQWICAGCARDADELRGRIMNERAV